LVFPQEAEFRLKWRLVLGCVLPLGKYPLAIIRVDCDLPIDAQRLFKVQTRNSVVCGVRVRAAALLVGDENTQRRGIAYRPKAGIAPPI
jgi:hypothetical protein